MPRLLGSCPEALDPADVSWPTRRMPKIEEKEIEITLDRDILPALRDIAFAEARSIHLIDPLRASAYERFAIAADAIDAILARDEYEALPEEDEGDGSDDELEAPIELREMQS